MGISIEGADPIYLSLDPDANIAGLLALAQDLAEALAAAEVDAGTTLADLFIVEVVNTALGQRLALTAAYDFTYTISIVDGDPAEELGFRDGQNNVVRAPEMGRYQLRFSDLASQIVTAGGSNAEAALLVVGTDTDDTLASFRPLAINLGDIDGSGIDSYIAGVNDDLVSGTSTLLILKGDRFCRPWNWR